MTFVRFSLVAVGLVLSVIAHGIVYWYVATITRQDAFLTREPLVTLLTPAEQQRVAQRYSYDYRRHSTNMALIILGGSLLGVASSLYRGTMIPALVAGALGAEQIVRLVAFRRGPAASVLRFLARPFVRKLL